MRSLVSLRKRLGISLVFATSFWVVILSGVSAKAAPVGVVAAPDRLRGAAAEGECGNELELVSSAGRSRAGGRSVDGDDVADLAAAKRSFQLLDVSAARARLEPLLTRLRQERSYGASRARGELLSARIAALAGDQDGYRQAVAHLARVHLYGTPDPSEFPPDILGDVRRAKERLWSQGVTKVTFVPVPEVVRVNQSPVRMRGDEPGLTLPFPVPRSLLVEVRYRGTDWLTVPTPVSGISYPLAASAVAREIFADASLSPVFVWTLESDGNRLRTWPGWRLVWSTDSASEELCRVLGGAKARAAERPLSEPITDPVAVAAPPGSAGAAPSAAGIGTSRHDESAPGLWRNPWLWSGIAALAITGGATWAATSGEDPDSARTGGVSVRW